MRNFFKVFCGTFLMLFILNSLAIAGNGKIAGTVKDNSGKPVPGVTVMLQGTRLGGSADLEGKYFVLNIPPGRYTVTFSAVGYEKKTLRDVVISSDVTTDLNVILAESAVEVQGVIVEAERKLVDKTLTSTKSTINSEELSNTLPAATTYEILQTTPSVYRGFVRGGRIEQTKTIIDGVDVSDQFYSKGYATAYETYNRVTRFRESQQSTNISANSNSLSELTVNTGALGAEYQSAAAGVINYSLKEGKGPITGKFYLRSSAGALKYKGPSIYGDVAGYFAERNALAAATDATSKAKALRYTYTDGKYVEEHTNTDAELTLSGGLSEDLGMFLSAGFRNNPDCRLPNQSYKEMNSQLKFFYNLTPEIKLSAFGILNDKGKLFGWKNTEYNENFRFFLEGVPMRDGLNWVGSLKMSHFLSNNTFYEVQLSNSSAQNRIGFVDGNNDGIVSLKEDGDFITFADTGIVNRYMDQAQVKFFAMAPGNESTWETSSFQGQGPGSYRLGRPGIFFEDFTNSTMIAKVDFTSQFTFNHQLKAGLMFKSHDLNMNRIASYIGGVDGKRPYVTEIWDVKPTELAAYLQDRIEYQGLVINVGLRYDMWNPNAGALANDFQPWVTVKDNTSYGSFDMWQQGRGEDVKAWTFLSPRIAVSHPISDKAAVYFSFSKMFQPPPFSSIYTEYNGVGNTSLPNIISVNRDPYYTTNYEMGGQWEIIDRLALNINAYYRDIENYSTASFVITPSAGSKTKMYYLNFGTGYADARGVELQVQTLPTPVSDFLTLSGRLSYTYSYVKGAGIYAGRFSDNPNSLSFLAGDSTKFSGHAPITDYKYYRKTENNLGGSNSSLTSGFDRAHRIGYTLFFKFPYEISLTSMGTFQSGFYYAKSAASASVRVAPLEQGPWNSQIDLRIEKAFTVDRFRFAIFADIKNLFDSENILAYDATNTGITMWETTGVPTGTKNRPVGVDGTSYYDIPREIFFGITIDF